MKITLREMFLLVLVVAVSLGWWLDHARLRREQTMVHRLLPPRTMEAVVFAWNQSARKYPLKNIIEYSDDELFIGFGWGTASVGAGETITLKKVGGAWQVTESREYDA